MGHQVIVFSDMSGGEDLGNFLAVYNPDLNRWTELHAEGEWPEERDSAAVMLDPVGRTLVIYGGTNYDDDPLGDTWTYDLLKARWHQASPVGDRPRPRSGAATAFDPVGGLGYVYGGEGQDVVGRREALGDLWVYDVSTNRWTELRPSGDTPPSRSYAVMVLDRLGNRLLLFGGVPGDEYGLLGDLWAFDLAASRWAKLPQEGETPSARWISAAVVSEATNQVFLFGGSDTVGLQNDAWLYDLSSGRWEPVSDGAGDTPAARGGHALLMDTDHQALVLLGGTGAESVVLSDLWVYGLSR